MGSDALDPLDAILAELTGVKVGKVMNVAIQNGVSFAQGADGCVATAIVFARGLSFYLAM